jgi:hypothetical protein
MRWLALLSVFVLPTLLLAQAKEKDKNDKITASGTIKSIAPGVLQVMSSAGDQWQVALDPKAEVYVTGTATPAFLKPGMLVKFSGKFNKKAETVEPLASITVFTPREDKEKWNRGKGEEGGANSELAKGLFQIDEPKPDAKKQKPMETFDVSTGGEIASARGGKVSVRGPSGSFKLELAKDATVALDVSDYRLARPGDKIDLEGWTYNGDVTKVVASRVTIRLAEPVGDKKK